MSTFKIALIRGDGIGPEVVEQTVRVMERVGEKFGHSFTWVDVLMGGCATDAVGKSYPDGTAEICRACDAVLLGAVGGPKWGSDRPAHERPETALLAIRKDLGLYANLRPAALRPALAGRLPSQAGDRRGGHRPDDGPRADRRHLFWQAGQVSDGGPRRGGDRPDGLLRAEIERIGRRAFELARLRRGKVTSVDKANVLETSRLWRATMHRLAAEYPDVAYEDMLVDNCAMQLVRKPRPV